jgi:hypothetical protein
MSELRDKNIRVNVLTPGQVATPALEEVMDEETKAQLESLIPRRKMGRTEEIASVALVLALGRLELCQWRRAGYRRRHHGDLSASPVVVSVAPLAGRTPDAAWRAARRRTGECPSSSR